MWGPPLITANDEPEANNTIKMEVGIEDCLHIEFEYNKSKFHLQDAVLGKIFFLLVCPPPSPPTMPYGGYVHADIQAAAPHR